jgi:hypothetical protein
VDGQRLDECVCVCVCVVGISGLLFMFGGLDSLGHIVWLRAGRARRCVPCYVAGGGSQAVYLVWKVFQNGLLKAKWQQAYIFFFI